MNRPTDYNPTDTELARAIAQNAAAAGFTLEEIRGILLAEIANGVLRANCPKWLRQTQFFLASKGQLYPVGLVAKATALYLDLPEHAEEMGIAAEVEKSRVAGRERGAPN